MEEIVKMFKALSDNTRLRIVNLLLEGELCVCEVMEVLKISQSKASRHLTYLKNAGLAESRREGLWMHYSLTPPGKGVQRDLLAAAREAREEIGTLKRDLKNLERVSKKKMC